VAAVDGEDRAGHVPGGVDPVADGVALELSPPGGAFYPVSADVMPVGMRPFFGGWRITDAAGEAGRRPQSPGCIRRASRFRPAP
jgi:hypothetical protein